MKIKVHSLNTEAYLNICFPSFRLFARFDFVPHCEHKQLSLWKEFRKITPILYEIFLSY